MKHNSISEITMSMLPDISNNMTYKDLFILGDNFDDPSLPQHRLEGHPLKMMFVILMVCLEGRIRIRVNLREITITSNHLFIAPEGSIIDMVNYDEPCKIGFLFFSNVERPYLPNNKTWMHIMSLMKNQPTLIHIHEESVHHFVECYKLIRHAISDTHLRNKDDVIKGYMHVISSYWLSEFEENEQTLQHQKITRNEQIFDEFIELVRTNYTHHREVSFYADKLCITPKYLSVVVKNVSGRTPMDWIRDLVILDAKAMLLNGNQNIQQISDTLHFANPSFFGKYFKESVGCSPGKYRRNEYGL